MNRLTTHRLPPVLAGKLTGGFTLVELLAVVLIIAVLAGLTLGVANYVGTRVKVSQTKAQLAALATAIENFKADRGYYPTSTIIRLSWQPYNLHKNNSLLIEQLRSGNYISFRSIEVKYNSESGVTNIVDGWGNPIIYYCFPTNVVFGPLSKSTNYVLSTIAPAQSGYYDYWTEGGQVNFVSYDLFSFGPNGATFIPGFSGLDIWSTTNSADDDIWSGKR